MVASLHKYIYLRFPFLYFATKFPLKQWCKMHYQEIIDESIIYNIRFSEMYKTNRWKTNRWTKTHIMPIKYVYVW